MKKIIESIDDFKNISYAMNKWYNESKKIKNENSKNGKKHKNKNKELYNINKYNKDNENFDDINVDEPYVNPNYGKLENKTKDGISIIEASGIDNALQEMKLEDYDKHPEKRMRQAWNEFFEKRLPNYKEEYPNLKRSQYIDMIQKEFKTSPENPVYLANVQKAKKNQEEEDQKE